MAVKLPVSLFPPLEARAAKPIYFVVMATLLLMAAGKKRREAEAKAQAKTK